MRFHDPRLALTVKEPIVYRTIKIIMPLILHLHLFCVAILNKALPTESFTIQTPHISRGCEIKFSFIPF
jgi:hypothetical protein